MPYTTGYDTKNVFRYGPESNKLHLEFAVEADSGIRKGMPVVLDPSSTAARTIIAFDPATHAAGLIIGYAIHDGHGSYGHMVTCAVRGYIVIEGVAGTGDVVPGPVDYEEYVAQSDPDQPLDIDDPSGTSHTGTPEEVGSNKYKQTAKAGANYTDAELLTSNGWALTAATDGAFVLVLLK